MTAAGRDRGRVSVFVAVTISGLIAVLGVAVDATGQLRTLMRAQNLAAEAARAGGQAINAPQAISGGEVVVDPAVVESFADAYLTRAATDQPHERQIQVIDGGTALRVTVTLVYETRILGLFGIQEIDVTATETATLVTG